MLDDYYKGMLQVCLAKSETRGRRLDGDDGTARAEALRQMESIDRGSLERLHRRGWGLMD